MLKNDDTVFQLFTTGKLSFVNRMFFEIYILHFVFSNFTCSKTRLPPPRPSSTCPPWATPPPPATSSPPSTAATASASTRNNNLNLCLRPLPALSTFTVINSNNNRRYNCNRRNDDCCETRKIFLRRYRSEKPLPNKICHLPPTHFGPNLTKSCPSKYTAKKMTSTSIRSPSPPTAITTTPWTTCPPCPPPTTVVWLLPWDGSRSPTSLWRRPPPSRPWHRPPSCRWERTWPRSSG